jgi:hypothetical protein
VDIIWRLVARKVVELSATVVVGSGGSGGSATPGSGGSGGSSSFSLAQQRMFRLMGDPEGVVA